MKKIIISLLAIIMTALPCSAQSSLSWYCCHTKDHTQPTADAPMAFIENYNAYYRDTNHKSWSDKEKVIYLTFDAGYENGNVEKILDVLKEKGVHGSFFILENLTVRNPGLVQRMAKEGHLICNHTATHKNMANIAYKDEFKKELDRLNEACEAIGVTCSKYYRPPEGTFTEENLKWANELGYKTLFWSFAYADWDNDSQPDRKNAKEKIISGTHNGEIILLHPTSETNAEILGELIDEWRAMGFRFALPDELK